MSQQLVNSSHRDGSVTFTNRMTNRYAVVSEPYKGVHKKPQDPATLARRKQHWRDRNDTK